MIIEITAEVKINFKILFIFLDIVWYGKMGGNKLFQIFNLTLEITQNWREKNENYMGLQWTDLF